MLTQALQQANAEKAVLAADKGRLEQEVANLRLQMSVFQKAMEGGQLLPSSAPLAMSAPSGLPQPVSPVHPMVQQVSLSSSWQKIRSSVVQSATRAFYLKTFGTACNAVRTVTTNPSVEVVYEWCAAWLSEW